MSKSHSLEWLLFMGKQTKMISTVNKYGIISFKNNTKGDIICFLKSENNNGERFEGEVIYLNLKPEYKGRKIMLISKIVLNEENLYKYEHFVFYC